jgi:hypothetical protein
MRSIRPIIVLALTLTLLLTSLVAGCSNKDIAEATGDIVSGAQSVVLAMQAASPDPEKLARIQHFVSLASGFQTSLANALTSDQQAALFPLLQAVIEAFQADVLPQLHVSVNIGIAIAGIDAALRIVANHFKHTADAVGPKAARGDVTLLKAKKRIDDYLATPKVKKPKE